MPLDEKGDSDFTDLISKRYDTKKKYSYLSKAVFKTLTDLSGLKIRKEVRNLKIYLRVDAFQPFTMTQNDQEDLFSLSELTIGSIDAGNDNSKMKNRGMAM